MPIVKRFLASPTIRKEFRFSLFLFSASGCLGRESVSAFTARPNAYTLDRTCISALPTIPLYPYASKLIPTLLSATPPRVAQMGDLFDLPDEILLEIIAAVLEFQKKQDFYRFSNGVPAPLSILISHISSRLRRLILSTPKFWATLENSLLVSSPLFEDFFARSKETLLDITITPCTSKKRLDRLVAFAHRWQRFTITSIGADTPYRLPAILDRLRDISAPQLEYFCTRDLDIPPYEYGGTPIRIFSDETPKLRTLKLETAVPRSPATVLYYGEWHDLWNEMLSLTRVRLIGNVVAPWPIQKITPIAMSSLKFLNIQLWEDCLPACPVSYISSLLWTISTESPCQCHLSLPRMSPDSEDVSYFLASLRRRTFNFDRVMSLAWQVELENLDDVRLMAQSFPNVETLTFKGCGDIFIEVLAQMEEPCLLWPRLRRMNLPYCGAVPFLDTTFYGDEEGKDLAWLQTQCEVKIISYDTLDEEISGWDKTA
ncbi:hypothetical protein Hypma_009921 [Hypsizygus marmoreus]|uniref:F-box domain-containing protein n=1 Tax=Hypsizygus marmoreus TaxID=39966 RepID=A0A369JL96_HYPMA|nr:hypothetical protein Hypma_009921 [Hypsizygus marmoreus]